MFDELIQKIMSMCDMKGVDVPSEKELAALRASSFPDLYQAMMSNDASAVQQIIHHISREFEDRQARDAQYERLGHIARQFQNALFLFRSGLGPSLIDNNPITGDVKTQIQKIIEITQGASFSVFQLLEKQFETFSVLEKESVAMLEEFNTQGDVSPHFGSVKSMLEKIKSTYKEFENTNSDIFLSQSYQDITGQMLSRIQIFVDAIEDGLLEIVRVLANDGIDEALVSLDSEKQANVCAQDDVDALLSRLGF